MKKFILSILILLIILPLSVSAQDEPSGSLNVQPTQINVSTVPGGSISGEIILRNGDDKNIKVECQILDIISSLTGNTYGLLDEKDPYSVARWIKLDKNNFEVSSAEPLKVSYKVSAPYGIKVGGYWGIIFFNVQKEASTTSGNHVSVTERIGVKAFVNITELKKAEVVKFEACQYISDYQNSKFKIKIKNLGSVDIEPKGKVKIEGLGRAESQKESLPFSFPKIKPGETKEITVDYNTSLMMGKYKAYLEFGNPEIKSYEIIYFWAVPLRWFLTAIFVTIILVLLALIIIKRFRRKLKKSQIYHKEKK